MTFTKYIDRKDDQNLKEKLIHSNHLFVSLFKYYQNVYSYREKIDF